MTTATTTTVHLVTLYDGADFDRVLDQRAFATWIEADTQGALRVKQRQGERRAAGEGDPAFVNAIRYDVQQVHLGAAWGVVRSEPNPLTQGGRASAAYYLGLAARQTSRVLRGDRFGVHQYSRDPASYREGVRHFIRLARAYRTGGAA